MMSKFQAVELVLQERKYQDRTYSPDQVMSSGLSREWRDKDVTPHLVLLDGYVKKAMAEWIVPGSNKASLKQIAKIAAIAIRALERCGGSEELLEEGLR